MINLRSGSTGAEVAFLQQWLAALNPKPAPYSTARPAALLPQTSASTFVPRTQPALTATGRFDQDTAATVLRFQCDNAVHAATLGAVDYSTWWQLAQVARTRYFSVGGAPTTPTWLARLCSPLPSASRGLNSARFLEGYTEIFGAPGKSADGLQKLLTYINADGAVNDVRWAAYMLATVHRECGPRHGMLPVPEDGCDDNARPVCSPLKDGNQRSYGDPVPCGPSSDLEHALTTPPALKRLEAEIRASAPPQAPYKTGQRPVTKWTPSACPAGKEFHTYYGRGYVQLTGLDNYRAMCKVTGQDLVHFPEKVLDADTAYKIMSHGMRNGSFRHGHKLAKYISGVMCNYYDARNIINSRHDAASIVADFAKKYEIALYYCLGD